MAADNAANGHSIFTVWAAYRDDLSATWMIWACDEYSYEADPDARDAELAEAKKRVGGDCEFREVTVKVSYAEIQARFVDGVVEGALADA